MKVKVELEIEVIGNVTEEEAIEFFNDEFGEDYCSPNNPLKREAIYHILETNIEIEE